MSDEPFNLVLEHLKAVRSELSELRIGQKEVITRLSQVEHSVSALHRDNAIHAENNAIIHARLDRLNDRVGRIEVRLDIVQGG